MGEDLVAGVPREPHSDHCPANGDATAPCHCGARMRNQALSASLSREQNHDSNDK